MITRQSKLQLVSLFYCWTTLYSHDATAVITRSDEIGPLEAEFKENSHFQASVKQEFEEDLRAYVTRHDLGAQPIAKEGEEARFSRKELMGHLRTLSVYAREENREEYGYLTQQAARAALLELECYREKARYIPTSIQGTLTDLQNYLRSDQPDLATGIDSPEAWRIMERLQLWSAYFDFFRPVCESYYRVKQARQLLDEIQIPNRPANPHAYWQLAHLGFLIDEMVPPEWTHETNLVQAQTRFEGAQQAQNPLDRKRRVRESFFRAVPWIELKYFSRPSIRQHGRASYDFWQESRDELREVESVLRVIKAFEGDFWQERREGAFSHFYGSIRHFTFPRINHAGGFWKSYFNLSRIFELLKIGGVVEEDLFLREVRGQSTTEYSHAIDPNLVPSIYRGWAIEMTQRREAGEFSEENNAQLTSKARKLETLRLFQAVGECVKELNLTFRRAIGLSTENFRTLKNLRNRLHHLSSVRQLMISILPNHEDLFQRASLELSNLFRAVFDRWVNLSGEFITSYFRQFPQESDVLAGLDNLDHTVASLEQLRNQIPEQGARRRGRTPLETMVLDFNAARQELLYSWEQLESLVTRFIPLGMPDISLGTWPLCQQYSEQYGDLFNNPSNMFYHAVDFCLSSYRVYCKQVMQGLVKLVNYGTLQNQGYEFKRQYGTLRGQLIKGKQIAHNRDLSLNWNIVEVRFTSTPRFQFISQDLLRGYRFGTIGIEEGRVARVGEMHYPGFLEFLQTVNPGEGAYSNFARERYVPDSSGE